MPFWWMVILLVWAFFSKSAKTKKRLRIASLCILILFTNPFIYRSVILSWQPGPKVMAADRQYDVAIILGGLAGYDRYERGHFGQAADRFIKTANLYHMGIIRRIIISGGTGSLMQNEPPESLFLRQSFIENGIPDSAILIESRSRNTYENAIYSKRIIDSLQAKPPYIVVTSAQHMPRSEQVFKKAGYHIIPVPCDFRVTEQKPSLDNTIVPSIALLNEWSGFIKEIVGLYVYKMTGKA